MKITILCENTVGRLMGLGEHGFSAFIESDQGNYLFDTGSGHTVVKNSLELNKDLKGKNMADEREFDEVRTARMIDLFVTETLGLKKVA